MVFGTRHSGGSRNPLALPLVLRVVARTDSRPCVVRQPSLAAGYFLLLAQKKVTKEKGTLGSAPLAERAVRYGRTGSAHRASCPVVRIGAIPRAARVRCTRLVRPSFAATQRDPKSKAEAPDICDRLLLRQGLPRSALPGPL